MAETLHPHGLWNAYESAAPGYPVTIAYMDGAKEVTICDVTEQGARCARLIAEAPAMLEALKQLLDYDNLGAYERSNAYRTARAILARIDG